MTTPIADQLKRIVSRHIDAGAFDGAVTLFARDGRIELLDAQGQSEHEPDRSVGTDSVFAVMSMTKPVTAACACILIDEGRLSPEDPVAKWIPEFGAARLVRTLKPGQTYAPFPPTPGVTQQEPDFDYAPASRLLTVKDLLTFTSGLQMIGVPNPTLPEFHEKESLADWVARLGAASLEYQPGTRWSYSNATAYDVLGRVVEVASGAPFGDFARDRLFAPLAMSDTAFGQQSNNSERTLPLGPFFAGQRIMQPDYASGSAGLFTTAGDYWRFAQMLLDQGQFEGRRIMSADAVTAMTTNHIGALAFPGVRAREYAVPLPTRHSEIRYGYGVAIVPGPTADTPMPAGSFGWDGIGTRRFWVIPGLNAVLVMLMTGILDAADAAHREMEAAVNALVEG